MINSWIHIIHDNIEYIRNSVMDTIMDIHNSVMDIHNHQCVFQLHHDFFSEINET